MWRARAGVAYPDHDRDEPAVPRGGVRGARPDAPADLDRHAAAVRGEALAGLRGGLSSLRLCTGRHAPRWGRCAVPARRGPSRARAAARRRPAQTRLGARIHKKVAGARGASGHAHARRLPHPPWPLATPSRPLPSNTTRGPMFSIASARSPRPSPSPCGRPESSKSALNDSMCGATSSCRIGTSAPLSEGHLNCRSRCTAWYECLL